MFVTKYATVHFIHLLFRGNIFYDFLCVLSDTIERVAETWTWEWYKDVKIEEKGLTPQKPIPFDQLYLLPLVILIHFLFFHLTCSLQNFKGLTFIHHLGGFIAPISTAYEYRSINLLWSSHIFNMIWYEVWSHI